jgi:hypothetical protein
MSEIKINIKSVDIVLRQRDWKLSAPIPKEEYYDFRCKYFISADETFLGTMKK